MSADVVIAFEDNKAQLFFKNLGKKVKSVTDRDQDYIRLLSVIVFRDIIEHFQRQEGPRGAWKPWSDRYAAIARKRGQRMILQRTGKLRGGWIPTNVRRTSDGVLWYNPVEYGKKHDEGLDGMPKRQFAWLSRKAADDIGKQTARFLEDF